MPKSPNVNKKKLAYKTVIKDLSSHKPCKDYAFGCFQCMCLRLAQDLESVYDLNFGNWTKVK